MSVSFSVYLAGPMTGKPLWNFPEFEKRTKELRQLGWIVESPHELTHQLWNERYGRDFDPEKEKLEWGNPLMSDMIGRDLAAVARCSHIALLPGWEKSKGANLELSVARALGKTAFDAVTGALIIEKSSPETILQEAQRLVHGDRQADYGHPIDDYTRTGRLWGAILNQPDIDPRICCLMMAAVKISREVNKPKRDNRVDGAGYFECADLIAQRQSE